MRTISRAHIHIVAGTKTNESSDLLLVWGSVSHILQGQSCVSVGGWYWGNTNWSPESCSFTVLLLLAVSVFQSFIGKCWVLRVAGGCKERCSGPFTSTVSWKAIGGVLSGDVCRALVSLPTLPWLVDGSVCSFMPM